MREAIQNFINQIRRLSKVTGVKPDPDIYSLQGNNFQRMHTRLKLSAVFLKAVNENLEAQTEASTEKIFPVESKPIKAAPKKRGRKPKAPEKKS